MEMHQVRYFLAVARTLNFTRAAEQCNVSQPALTRAIQQLEDELSGKLLRREGKLSHLTDLGARMVPLMQQCYESAIAAKTLAISLKKGSALAISLALSQTIELQLLAGCLAEMQRVFPGLQLKILRGNSAEISDYLKKGQVEIAIAGPLGQAWDRLDARPLFNEKFAFVVHQDHKLAGRNAIDFRQLAEEQILVNSACECAEETTRLLDEHGVAVCDGHQISSQQDLLTLLEANLGAAFLPQSSTRRASLRGVPINGFEMSREVSLYAVAGRQRSPAVEALTKLLRTQDWSRHTQ